MLVYLVQSSETWTMISVSYALEKLVSSVLYNHGDKFLFEIRNQSILWANYQRRWKFYYFYGCIEKLKLYPFSAPPLSNSKADGLGYMFLGSVIMLF